MAGDKITEVVDVDEVRILPNPKRPGQEIVNVIEAHPDGRVFRSATPKIVEAARPFVGATRLTLEYHVQQNGIHTNYWLDDIAAAPAGAHPETVTPKESGLVEREASAPAGSAELTARATELAYRIAAPNWGHRGPEIFCLLIPRLLQVYEHGGSRETIRDLANALGADAEAILLQLDASYVRSKPAEKASQPAETVATAGSTRELEGDIPPDVWEWS